jgi:hypothetical protein
MPTSALNGDIVRDLNEKAVRQLVAAHRLRTDEPLVLAIRFNLDDPQGHIHLLEVLDQFPGADDEELLVTRFGPSANLLVLGDLHIALGSPAQVHSAARRGDPIAVAARSGVVVFDDGSARAAELRRELRL